MGKTLRRLTTVLVILGFVLPVSGLEPVKDSITATIRLGSNIAIVDAQPVKLRTTIDIRDGKTFIYSADLGNIMDIRFPWSPGSKMATGFDPLTNTTLIFYADSNKVGIDSDDFTSTIKPYIKKKKLTVFSWFRFATPAMFLAGLYLSTATKTSSSKNLSFCRREVG